MLKVEDLKKSFFNHKVLKGITFEVLKGSLFGFVGVNGAGKSTLIKCILEFLKLDNGKIFVKDVLINDNDNFKKSIGYLPEVFQPPPDLKCGEFLNYCYKLILNIDCPKIKILELLEIVGLQNVYNISIRKLSKGMRQRIGIAQSIIHDPDLLILDEPFSGLDPIGRYELKQLFKKLNYEGKTIFFSSHNLNEIQDLCTSVAILHNGFIVYSGEINEVFQEFDTDNFEQAFLKAIQKERKEV